MLHNQYFTVTTLAILAIFTQINQADAYITYHDTPQPSIKPQNTQYQTDNQKPQTLPKSDLHAIDEFVENGIRTISPRLADKWQTMSPNKKAIVYLTCFLVCCNAIRAILYGLIISNDGFYQQSQNSFLSTFNIFHRDTPISPPNQYAPQIPTFTNEAPDKECIVCMCNTINRKLPCGHYYCDTCITMLTYGNTLYRNRLGLEKGECSVCRRIFKAENVQAYEYVEQQKPIHSENNEAE